MLETLFKSNIISTENARIFSSSKKKVGNIDFTIKICVGNIIL